MNKTMIILFMVKLAIVIYLTAGKTAYAYFWGQISIGYWAGSSPAMSVWLSIFGWKYLYLLLRESVCHRITPMSGTFSYLLSHKKYTHRNKWVYFFYQTFLYWFFQCFCTDKLVQNITTSHPSHNDKQSPQKTVRKTTHTTSAWNAVSDNR